MALYFREGGDREVFLSEGLQVVGYVIKMPGNHSGRQTKKR